MKWLFTGLCLAVLMLTGCGSPATEGAEPRKIEDELTAADIELFLRIVDSLPEKNLHELPTLFAPPPAWSSTRTLPINELAAEETLLVSDHWQMERVTRPLQRKRGLVRALRQERLTLDQFVGLARAIAIALSRGTLRETQDLAKLIDRGETELSRLKEDGRPFASLKLEQTFPVLQQASWITRVERAKQLVLIPEGNVLLVREHRERLGEIFPRDFKGNPFDAVNDPLDDQGTPFLENAETGFDDQIDWNPAEALTGRDLPDRPRVMAPEDPVEIRVSLPPPALVPQTH